ncbi:polar amino acid transport system permease protein [Conyzicola lurida]|uniref:Polar amino acid transport system permease protein n=1 Tax=Conyzicola lurida TaxID=1172621 RepID=A0A841AJP6_9MICO|nr:amino acid ABC transporter permease [Conyzicola lurida]MBB5841956.1 polar amino acid transport system permease protein [Conyzicola lurida]
MSELTPVDVSTARRRRRPGQWIATIVVGALAAAVLWTFVTNPTVEWPVITKYLFFPAILQGLWTTIYLTIGAMAIGIVLGILLAAARLSPNKLVKAVADFFVWFFRGTPTLVQLIFWYNIAIFIPRVELGLPGADPFFSASTNDLINPVLAALLGLGLNEAAYMCEVVRGGLLSVPNGQKEAAQSLGLSSRKSFLQITLPQAMRAIVPPTGNQIIIMLKGTSLVSVMAVADLFYSAQGIYVTTGKVIPLLIVASIWYLFMTSVLYFLQSRLEKRFGRGFNRRVVGRVKSKPPRPVDPATPTAAKVPASVEGDNQ